MKRIIMKALRMLQAAVCKIIVIIAILNYWVVVTPWLILSLAIAYIGKGTWMDFGKAIIDIIMYPINEWIRS